MTRSATPLNVSPGTRRAAEPAPSASQGPKKANPTCSNTARHHEAGLPTPIPAKELGARHWWTRTSTRAPPPRFSGFTTRQAGCCIPAEQATNRRHSRCPVSEHGGRRRRCSGRHPGDGRAEPNLRSMSRRTSPPPRQGGSPPRRVTCRERALRSANRHLLYLREAASDARRRGRLKP